jgi:hypothetical protein
VTYFSAIPVPETTVGIALETERGVPVQPTAWLPIMGAKYKPDLQLLPDEGLRGSMVNKYDLIPGLRYDSHGWDSYPYLDTFPIFLRALLGSKDSLTAVRTATELVAEAKVGDKKILTLNEIPLGTVFVIDQGLPATEETVISLKSVKVKAGEYETECAALKYTHVATSKVTINTTELLTEAKAGATTVKTVTDPVAVGGFVVVGTGAGAQETCRVTKVTEVKAGEYTLTLQYPLAFTHVAKAVVTALSTHAFSLLNNSPATGNQPPSCTITDYAGETNWRQLPAAQLDSISLTGSAEALPKAAMVWMANAAITPSPPSPSFSTAEAPPGWTVQCSIGGTQLGYLVDWSFDLKRNVKNVPAITGTENFYQHFAGALALTGKIVVLEDPSATWLTDYQNGTLESIDLTLSDVESGFALNLHSSKMKFATGDLDRSKEWVEVPLEFDPIPSSEDALAGGVSPIVCTVANATTTEY